MAQLLEAVEASDSRATYHQALEIYREAQALFSLRHLSLADRATVEQCFRTVCRRAWERLRNQRQVPEELADLDRLLRTTYFCNFSLFQSLPDHWAIGQLFPVVPLHRLDEEPVVQGVLADITCDSDGVMKQFVGDPLTREALPLHPLREGEPYYLGVFLVGAYQEILGDLHNLFGDTNVVHVSAGDGGYVIDKAVEGETIMEVLEYVQFSRRYLLRRLRARVEGAMRNGAMRLEDSKPFMREVEDSLDAYTYYRVGEAPRS
jgi:arginine decarboxylase